MLGPFITLLFLAFLMIAPTGYLIDKIYSKHLEIAEEDYYEAACKFITDYDKENPVTSKDGELRLIDHRLKYDKNLTDD